MFVLGLKGTQHTTDQFRLKHIIHLVLSEILTIVNAKKNYVLLFSIKKIYTTE